MNCLNRLSFHNNNYRCVLLSGDLNRITILKMKVMLLLSEDNFLKFRVKSAKKRTKHCLVSSGGFF